MEEQKKKETVVLYPGVGVGHLAPMLELASALLRHVAGKAFHVAVALVEPPVTDPGFCDAVARAKAAHTSVSFHVLPRPEAASPGSGADAGELDMAARLRFLRAMNAPLRDFLRSLPVRALVLDMFCGDALDVAAELGLPAYFSFASGGTGLAVFLGLPALRAGLGEAGFRSLGEDAVLSSFPGAPPFRVSDLPADLIAGDGEGGEACAGMLRMAARMPEARGIIVNTFASLEPRAVRALRDGLCVPDGGATPPVYCVGPLVSPGGEDHGCLRWLDAQPDRSVVFLCFGSLGAFSATQLAEIAVGLESSGQRFLWVVRLRCPRGGAGNLSGSEDDLAAVLPAGFLDRTKNRGLVVASWAPQADVLRHRAAGAFVTHCGWNSALEGVAAGLPLLCWPLYAEQRLNKVWIVHEMRLGVEMVKTKATTRSCVDGGEEEEEDGVVEAAEVEEKVRWVMESDDDGARALRERVAAARDAAADALADGGSSRADFVQFIRDLENSERVHMAE